MIIKPIAFEEMECRMATSAEYIEFVAECLQGCGAIRYRKMFGEYMVYLSDKPILLVCDSTVYVKKLKEVEALLSESECGIPYNGAKEHYILDIENRELTLSVVSILEDVIPLPKPKKKKTNQ